MGEDQPTGIEIVSEILLHLDNREKAIRRDMETEYRWALGKENKGTWMLNEVLISIQETKKYIERRRLEGLKSKNDTKHKQTETF